MGGSHGQNVLLWTCSEDGYGSYRKWIYHRNEPSALPTAAPEYGDASIRWSTDPSYCLSVNANTFFDGQNMQIWKCSANNIGQMFSWWAESGLIILNADTTYCVAPDGGADGANIALRLCDGPSISDQKWSYENGFFKSSFYGKCLAVEHNEGSHGQNVLLWTCSEDGYGSYRKWIYHRNEPSALTTAAPEYGDASIRWSTDPSYCLSVNANAFFDGQNMQIWKCSANNIGQMFSWRAESGLIILNADTSYCVAPDGGADGANIALRRCDGPGISDQKWSYENGFFKSSFYGKCMAVEHNEGSNGQNVLLWTCSEDGYGSYRKWIYHRNEPSALPTAAPEYGDASIRWSTDPSYCLSVNANTFFDGQNMQIWKCS